MSIYSRTITDDDFIFIKGESGVDNIVQKISDSSRLNHCYANYAFILGERSIIASGASGSGAFGGDIHISGENTYGLGYHVYNFVNQSLTGGYDVGNTAKESIIWGNTIGIDCTHGNEHTWSDSSTDYDHLCKYMAVFGSNLTVGKAGQGSLISGLYHTIGNYFVCNALSGYGHSLDNTDIKYSNISGYGHQIGRNFQYSILSGKEHHIGNYVSFANIFGGDGNEVGDYVNNITILGYQNQIAGGSSSSHRSDIYMIGCNLYTNKSKKVLLGRWNENISGALLEFGDGNGTSGSPYERVSSFYIYKDYSVFIGYGHTIGTSNNQKCIVETSLIDGWENTINKNIYGCGIIGNHNRLGGNSADSGSGLDYCFIGGGYCHINHTHSSALGYYLDSTGSEQLTVGIANDTNSSYLKNGQIKFQVGTGSVSSGGTVTSRRTSFAVGYNTSDGHYIYIGDTKVTRDDAQQIPNILNKLNKVTSGTGRHVYGVDLDNAGGSSQGQRLFELSGNNTSGHAGKEGKIYEVPTGGIPANDLGFTIPSSNTLYRHEIKIIYRYDTEQSLDVVIFGTVYSSRSTQYQWGNSSDMQILRDNMDIKWVVLTHLHGSGDIYWSNGFATFGVGDYIWDHKTYSGWQIEYESYTDAQHGIIRGRINSNSQNVTFTDTVGSLPVA